MTKRRSINVDGFHHGGQPIPAACRVGSLVTTGGIHGMDPETQTLSDDAEIQIRQMFANLGRILRAAGASLDTVARVTVFVKDKSLRDQVNLAWVSAFPDAASRPARHTVQNENLPGNMLVQCDAIAVAEGASE